MKKFKGQYLLTSKLVKTNLTMKSEPFQNYNLYVDDNLPLYSFTNGKVKIVLLGFAFSILDSNLNESEIVSNFPIEFPAFLDYIDNLCGNFAIFYEKEGALKMYNDATAVLKIFYKIANNSIQAAASDPNFIKEVLDLELDTDPESVKFYKGKYFTKKSIRLGNKTKYKNVFQVLPNHSLNLDNAEASRFFPREKLEPLSIEESVKKVFPYFDNVIDATAKRHQINCSMTAGWDSRMVVATTLKHKDKVKYYTFRPDYFKDSNPDLTVPQKISKHLGLNYRWILKGDMIDQEAQENANASFDLMPQEGMVGILGGYKHIKANDDIVLLGTVSEICKNFYDNVEISDGKSLAQAALFPVIPYTLNFFDAKYKDLKEHSQKFGYDIRDLAHWEQDVTNFAAKRALYISFVTRAFSPFNSRKIIQTILAAPRKSRDTHMHKYYKTYFKTYAPELNKFPVNPTTKQRLMLIGKKLGLYQIYKLWITKFRK